MDTLISDYELKLKDRLSPGRLRHTLGVMTLAAELAQAYGGNAEKAVIAAALHDIAREHSARVLLGEAGEYGVDMDELEAREPVLLHAKIGAVIAEREWGIRDPEILEAIRLHITGDTSMCLTSQIVFLADFAEPGRSFGPASFARELSRVNRVRALEYIFNQEIVFVLNQGFLLHPKTMDARNYLLIHGDLRLTQFE